MTDASRDLPARAYEPVLRWARETPDRAAFIGAAGRRLSYGALAAASEQAAAGLAARGVRGGDRVLIVTENSLGAVVLMFAAQRLDAWPAIVNARMSGHEVAAMGQAAAARLAVYVIDNSTAAAAHAAAAGAETIELPGCGRVAFGRIDTGVVAEPVEIANDRQVGLLLFTSGTTGKPKAVMLSHRSLLNTGRSSGEARGIGPDDCLYGMAPLSHTMGATFFVMASVWAGATTRLVPRLDLEDIVRAVTGGEITFLMAVPTLFARLLEHAEKHAVELSRHRLTNLIAGGAPLDPTLKRRIETAFALPLGNGLAMTECAPVLRTPAGIYSAAESVGVPQGNVEIRLVAEGRDVADGAVGELWVRGPSLMLGYYRDAEANARAFRPGGWLATGDLVRRLESGEYGVIGREKEMIIRSGFNVYPGDVETAIGGHPAVAQCAVIGRPTTDGNEEVVAFVQLLPGRSLSEGELRQHIAPLLAPYKRPGRVIFLDSLPVGPTGKIFKSRLAQLAV
jgi:long-chain acyl-CoA synthetase